MLWRFLKKLGIKSPHDSAVPLLGRYPEETRAEKDTCVPLFIETLFTVARTWKQSRCPSTDEWRKKLWYIYTVEYYSAIKRNAFESVLMNWMNLEPIVQSEVSQKEKDKYCILMHGGSDVKASACNAGDLGLIPGSGTSPGEGNSNPFQSSDLENFMDKGAWWATVHEITKSQT